MAETNKSRAVTTDVLMNTLRRSMYRQGIVGSAMQSYYESLQSQETLDVLEEQNQQLRNNSASLKSLELTASRISANVFAIANLLQKQYNLAVRARMMKERERFRREALAEEAIFETPRYSATEEERDLRNIKSKKGSLTSTGKIALLIAQASALFASAIPEALGKAIQNAETQINEFTTSAKNFLSDLIDGYVEEDNSEAKIRIAEDEKEVQDNAIEDLETDRLLSEIEAEYEIQDQDIDSAIDAGSDLTTESDNDQEEPIEPPKPVEQPPVSMGETGMDIPVVSDIPEPPNYSTPPTIQPTPEPVDIDLAEVNNRDYGTPAPPVPNRPPVVQDLQKPALASLPPSPQISQPETPNLIPEVPRMAGTPSTVSTPQQNVNTPMAEALPRPSMTTDELNPYVRPRMENAQPKFNEVIPNLEPRSYASNMSMPVPFNPTDTTPPKPVNIGSVINEVTMTNKAMSLMPSSQKPNITLTNQTQSQVAEQSPAFSVPSPIANRGALEIGITFNAGR